YNMVTASGIAAPASTFSHARSRHLVRYLVNIRKTTPVNSKPGCQQRQDSMEKNPAQKGRPLAVRNNEQRPKIISGGLGWVPPLIIIVNDPIIRGIVTAIAAASRLRK